MSPKKMKANLINYFSTAGARTITLTVTGPDGKTGSAYVDGYIGFPVC